MSCFGDGGKQDRNYGTSNFSFFESGPDAVSRRTGWSRYKQKSRQVYNVSLQNKGRPNNLKLETRNSKNETRKMKNE